MDNESNFSYRFDSHACKSCGGKCCRGRGGYVWVKMNEVEAMAAAKSMQVPLFSRRYLRLVRGRLSLQERILNGEHICCFFDPIDCVCTIYQNRPHQCRTFPFWESLEKEPQKLLRCCPGISLQVSKKASPPTAETL